MSMVNKTTISQEELNKINQSIKLVSPKNLLEMKKGCRAGENSQCR